MPKVLSIFTRLWSQLRTEREENNLFLLLRGFKTRSWTQLGGYPFMFCDESKSHPSSPYSAPLSLKKQPFIWKQQPLFLDTRSHGVSHLVLAYKVIRITFHCLHLSPARWEFGFLESGLESKAWMFQIILLFCQPSPVGRLWKAALPMLLKVIKGKAFNIFD